MEVMKYTELITSKWYFEIKEEEKRSAHALHNKQ